MSEVEHLQFPPTGGTLGPSFPWGVVGATTIEGALNSNTSSALDAHYDPIHIRQTEAAGNNGAIGIATFAAPKVFGTIDAVRIVWRFGHFGRPGATPADRLLSLLDLTAVFVYDTLTISGDSPVGVFTTRTTTLTTDPRTSAAWTNAGLISLSSDGILPVATFAANGVFIAISGLWWEPVGVSNFPGDGRARRGPTKREPVWVCVYCGVPDHISRLTRISDPEHPFFDKYVCQGDMDDPIRTEEEQPSLFEGDLFPDES